MNRPRFDRSAASFAHRARGAGWAAASLAFAFACSSTSSDPAGVTATTTAAGTGGEGGAGGEGGSLATGGGGTGTAGSGGSIVVTADGSAGTGSGTAGTWFPADGGLPPGFTPSEKGGFKLGDPVPTTASDGGVTNGGNNCGAVLVGIVRDLSDAHPDFEDYCCGDTRNVVQATVGVDRKPVYALPGPAFAVDTGDKLMSGPAEFDQWYHTVDGVNQPYFIYFYFVPNSSGVFTFHSSSFFPLDGAGFGNQGRNHNFHFATELHTQFRYKGGETFRFTGDDDLWVFINDKLAIDLGGVHNAEDAQVSLDAQASALGIEKGKVYALDFFHAERHTTLSNFLMETNLEFVNCGIIIR